MRKFSVALGHLQGLLKSTVRKTQIYSQVIRRLRCKAGILLRDIVCFVEGYHTSEEHTLRCALETKWWGCREKNVLRTSMLFCRSALALSHRACDRNLFLVFGTVH